MLIYTYGFSHIVKQKEGAKNVSLQSFHGNGLTKYLQNAAWESGFQRAHNQTVFLARKSSEHLLYFLPLACSNNKSKLSVSHQKELIHTSSAPNFTVSLKDWLSNHLILIANGACIHESHRTITNQGRVFKRAQVQPLWIYTQIQCERDSKYVHFSVSPQKRFDCILQKLLPEGPAFNQDASRC